MPPATLTPRDRRAILSQLSRDRLGELTARFELEVDDRRSSESHIGAIVRKRSLDFRALLELLHRDELKAACRVLGLDTSGREKALLIDRILADEAPAAPPRACLAHAVAAHRPVHEQRPAADERARRGDA